MDHFVLPFGRSAVLSDTASDVPSPRSWHKPNEGSSDFYVDTATGGVLAEVGKYFNSGTFMLIPRGWCEMISYWISREAAMKAAEERCPLVAK